LSLPAAISHLSEELRSYAAERYIALLAIAFGYNAPVNR
jgi:hypothetical protein